MENVIKLTKQGFIAVVAMEEREYGNTFTQRFIPGLLDAFKIIGQDTLIKVVTAHIMVMGELCIYNPSFMK
jgi:hypothetical protein